MSSPLSTRADAAVAGLTPGYFALVMATGILSVGTELTGHHALSMILLWLCIAAFVILLSLTIVRTIRHRGEIVADFLDPGRDRKSVVEGKRGDLGGRRNSDER